MNSIDSNVTCKSALGVYSQRDQEFKKKYDEAQELRKSNEQSLASSCGQSRGTLAKPTGQR